MTYVLAPLRNSFALVTAMNLHYNVEQFRYAFFKVFPLFTTFDPLYHFVIYW